MTVNSKPCYVIAEIGVNHNGSLDLARQLIDAAVLAKADAVKFQTFRASQHYSRRTPGFSYLGGQDTFALIESLELDRSWQSRLLEHANERGVEFFSSPSDVEALAEPLDVLMFPDSTGPDRIGSYLRNLKTRTFAELLIDLRGGPDLAGRARRHAEAGR